jgi:hypothetical protein
MPWADEAACAKPPYDSWKWIVEPTYGREIAATVVKLFNVCAECPVRRECLRYALTAEFSALGCWGGTVATERRYVLPQDQDSIRHEDRGGIREPRERARKVEEAIELFEATFSARRQGWRAFAAREKEERARKLAAAKAAAEPQAPGTTDARGKSRTPYSLSKGLAQRFD